MDLGGGRMGCWVGGLTCESMDGWVDIYKWTNGRTVAWTESWIQ
jgi:hypothetical protein